MPPCAAHRRCLAVAALALQAVWAAVPEHMADRSLTVDGSPETLLQHESARPALQQTVPTAKAMLTSVCTARSPAHDFAALLLLPVLGLGVYSAVGFLERRQKASPQGKRPAKKLESDASRAVFVDAYKGHLLAAVITFHFAWDLQWAKLEQMNDNGDYTTEFSSFLAVALLGHLALVSVAPGSSIAGAIIYAAFVWFSVTRFKAVSQVYGVRLFCFCSGLVSALCYERPAFCERFFRRLGRIASGAAAMTVVSYAIRGHEGFITFGVLHMLFVCLLLHLPFLVLPRYVAALTAALLSAATVLDLLPEPEFSLVADHAMDWEPVLANLTFVLWGVAAHGLGVHKVDDVPNPLQVLSKRAPRWRNSASDGLPPFFVKLGQWSLPLFLCHQLVLFPVVQGLSKLCGHQHVSQHLRGSE
eukprot:gb/GFBE01073930.1/.p1 GENE.gb/GFBE01073930.1/~~gb/GFBE01073930.1/.p1  ORF type:complete len:416 (+),score=61.58 gb/GFBE01073930.1/:1-1248(+)